MCQISDMLVGESWANGSPQHDLISGILEVEHIVIQEADIWILLCIINMVLLIL